MPVYEYQCESCGHVVELLRSVSDRERAPDLEELADENQPKPDCTGVKPEIQGLPCSFKFVVSATPTTFRHNDFTGYGGLDKRRKMWQK